VKETTLSVNDIIDWTNKAIATIDNFGAYLLKKYVLPKFHRKATILAPKREKTDSRSSCPT